METQGKTERERERQSQIDTERQKNGDRHTYTHILNREGLLIS